MTVLEAHSFFRYDAVKWLPGTVTTWDILTPTSNSNRDLDTQYQESPSKSLASILSSLSMPHDSSLHVHAWEVQLVSTQFPDILGAVVQELINANPGRKLNEVLMSLIKTTFLKAKFILTVQARLF